MSKRRPPVINFAGEMSLPSVRDFAEAGQHELPDAEGDPDTLAFRRAAREAFEANRARRARHTAPARAVRNAKNAKKKDQLRIAVRRLSDRGLSGRVIAEKLGIGRNTVARLLRNP